MKSVLKLLFVAFFFILNSICFGQNDSLPLSLHGQNQAKALTAQMTLEVQYGQKIMNKKFPNGNLNTWGNVSLATPLSFVGISYTGGFRLGSKSQSWNSEYIGQLGYSLVIPQAIVINDTINAKITGYNFSFPLFAGVNLFPDAKHFDLLFDISAHFGRIRLFGAPAVKQKNPFFAPTISLTPRFKFKKFAFHIRCSYDYDLSNRNWKKLRLLDPPTLYMEKTQFSGMLIFVGIGKVLN